MRGMPVSGPYAWCDMTDSRAAAAGWIVSTTASASMSNPSVAAACLPSGHRTGTAGRVTSFWSCASVMGQSVRVREASRQVAAGSSASRTKSTVCSSPRHVRVTGEGTRDATTSP